MKKINIYILTFFLMLSTLAFSQAKKMVFFEHFTNASCAPCAQQNPIFDDNVLSTNHGRILHIAYHTNWPGADPMNAHNPAEVQSRVTYYGVSGVPNMRMQGNKYAGSPSGVTNTMVDNEAMLPSEIRIKVKDLPNDGVTRDVTVTVYSLIDLPAGSYKLRTAVVEKEKTYTTAPGSNGEKFFPNIFRKFLDNATGEDFTPPAVGDSVVFNFNYTLNTTVWDTTQIYVIAFVQNETTKSVINAGSNLDPDWEFVPTSAIYEAGILGSPSSFTMNLSNLAAADDSFMVVLTATHPTDWTAGYEFNSQNYTDTAYIMAPAGSVNTLTLQVTPGASSGFGNYSFVITSLSDTSLAPQKLQFFVSHNVTDVIVNSDGGFGDGSTTSAADFQQNYIDGLTLAGNTSFATLDLQPFLTAAKLGFLDSLESIFYNASWTFPSLTDASVAVFKSYLDNGGNMFIAGQDIGWEAYESTSGTGQTKLFYSNYMGANYIADGSQANNMFKPFAADPIFRQVPQSAVVDMYSGNFFPDVISAKPFAVPIFYYNADSSKVGAVRSNSSIFKTVYLAVSLEMIATADVRKQIIQISHDWFKGLISNTEFQAQTASLLLGQNYPNPTSDATTITFSTLTADAVLNILDLNGRLIESHKLSNGSDRIELNTTHLSSGSYFYTIENGQQSAVRKMLIIK